jgi:pimeloyl-ACP methyl ester carboxylesterase
MTRTPSTVLAAIAALTVAVAALGAPTQANAAPSLPSGASSAVVADPCPPEADDAVCGHVDVPLDRRHPGAATIPIAFWLYPHSEPGPAESVIMINWGGPGESTTAYSADTRRVLGAALGRHDLLLVDDRGRGRSSAIDCPALQHGIGSRLDAAAACAEQLGADADRYPTSEIAQDFEAVRSALGYQLVDFVGVSYGARDAAAYGTRFGRRLRSLTLDSPETPTPVDPFRGAADFTQGQVDRVATICARSALCGHSGRRAVREIASLVRRVRRQPIRGIGLDPGGTPHEVTIDPDYVQAHIVENTPPYVTVGEIPAAAEAQRRGDPAPLLRLAAETDFPEFADSGDPAGFSLGAFAATLCVDNPPPWSPEAPLPDRQTQLESAVRGASDRPFAPFTAEEVMFGAFRFIADTCLPWPAGGSRPPVDPGARYPDAPTLVLSGDIDASIPPATVRETLRAYPRAEHVSIPGSPHATLLWSSCASELATEFINTLRLPRTRCAQDSLFDYPAVTAFPRRAHESPAGTRLHSNRADRYRLRIARAAADAALDVLKRAFFPGVTGPGLRGGTWRGEFGDTWTLTLDRVRWTEDVAVSGTLHWSFDGGPLVADLHVDGPGRLDGDLHLEGGWFSRGAHRSIEITGTIAGQRIASRMPST